MPAGAQRRLDHTIQVLIRAAQTHEHVAEFFDARGEPQKAHIARERLAATDSRLAEALVLRTELYPPPR
jgi:hypothetical protein